MKTSNRQMSETYLIGAMLAVVGGYFDAYTYICRDHVFANAQTGNMVLFGLHLAQKQWKEALYYLFPIGAFFLGIILAEIIKEKYKSSERLHWRQIIIALEVLVVVLVGFLPEGSLNMLANVLISFVCSLQVESFRKVNGKAYATTMCTGNLRSATEQLFRYTQTKDKKLLQGSLEYYGIILFFMGGAAAGTILSLKIGGKAVLFTCILLVLVFASMFVKENAEA